MIDEYVVGLKENPEDTSTSKRLHRNKIRSTGSMGKGLDPNVDIIGTADLGKCRCVSPEGT